MCKVSDSAGEVRRAAEALTSACLARTERRTRLDLLPGPPIQRHLKHAYRAPRRLPDDFAALTEKLKRIV